MTRMEREGDNDCMDIILCSHCAKAISRTYSPSWSSSQWQRCLWVQSSGVNVLQSHFLIWNPDKVRWVKDEHCPDLSFHTCSTQREIVRVENVLAWVECAGGRIEMSSTCLISGLQCMVAALQDCSPSLFSQLCYVHRWLVWATAPSNSIIKDPYRKDAFIRTHV